ncbi:uncharacterized protein LOC114934197 [Nylanderia fulva]|uniref:uncharacterized protein LOC114934197 n=1 Tax=Nylanderia fulva TaxID=613905 RepID=UPI0010FB2DCF|nr:uncharacterized protein LOC114934197 [Nylanderia fulva]
MDASISLPPEIDLIVLSRDDISIEDAINLSTCEQFQHLISSNNTCSTARKKYNIKKESKKLEETDFEKKIRISMNYIKQLQRYVSLMSNNNLTQYKKNKFERLLRSIAEDLMIYYFVLNELSRIISEQQRKCNMTNRYYLGLISHYLKQYRFTYKLIKFLNMPKEKQLLEHLLTLVAQYFEPHISYSVIRMWFDDIAEKIRQHYYALCENI